MIIWTRCLHFSNNVTDVFQKLIILKKLFKGALQSPHSFLILLP